MNNKDISVIRKHLNPEKNNITIIRGCYVSSQGEIISTFSRSLHGMGQEEAEKYLAIFKKVLSGTQGQNLLDIDFEPEKMNDSPEYQHFEARQKEMMETVHGDNPYFIRHDSTLTDVSMMEGKKSPAVPW